MAKRSYGTGSLMIRRGKWFGQWWANGRQVGKVVGPVRTPGAREGLTKPQAERELRRIIDAVQPVRTRESRTLEDAGKALVTQVTKLSQTQMM